MLNGVPERLKNYILCIFLILFPRIAISQDIETITILGDSLFSNQEFDIALNEYQRAYFFSGPENKQNLAEKIAGCYLEIGNYKLTRIFCDSAIFYAVSDKSVTDAAFRKILSYILERDFGYALLQLNKFNIDSSTYFQHKLNLYQGVCYFGLKEYDLSLIHFENAVSPNDTIKLQKLHQLYKERNLLNRPNPFWAAGFSILLPGSGQAYTGNIDEGLNSVLLLTSLAYIVMYTSPIYIFIVVPFFFRYYLGGIVHAKQNAEIERSHRRNYYYNCLMNIILTENIYQ